jgi:hypothetical protein
VYGFLASTAPGRIPASLAVPAKIDRYEVLGVLRYHPPATLLTPP